MSVDKFSLVQNQINSILLLYIIQYIEPITIPQTLHNNFISI